jgi:hypothetical protein
MEVWQAQQSIRGQLGMRPVHMNGIVQRYRWAAEPHPQDGRAAELAFTFRSALAAEGVWLLMEQPGDFEILLNGEAVPNSPAGWLLDKSFERVPLPGLRAGENELLLRCGYRNRMELEDIYLLGDFGVDAARRLVPEPEVIRTGDWTLQGYPHYFGTMTYAFPLRGIPPEKRALLRMKDFSASTAVLRVNGNAVAVPWKAAASVDITAWLENGAAELEIDIVATPRNLLGPFHTAEPPAVTGDGAFRVTGAESVEGYNLHPYGLLSPPQIFVL